MDSKTFVNRQHEIESQSASGAGAQLSKLVSQWNQMWESLLQYLSRGSEPQVWQRRDRFGNVWWIAYDPASRQSLLCSTEQEVRIWLEQVRYR